ncbi:endonuclease domain-containing protein, partial [bacterium]|nr:endonuclease domain-containing protein [bacterium]
MRNEKLDPELLEFIRNLRKSQTSAEEYLWKIIRNRTLLNAKFRRQHPFPPYVLDFYCHEASLAIELGGGHHNNEEHVEYDKSRDEFLKEKGITVLRFWNRELFDSPESVIEAIIHA